VKPTVQATIAATAGAGSATVPNVIGKSPDEARQAMENLGFTSVQTLSVPPPAGTPPQKKGTIAAIINLQDNKIVSPGQTLPKDSLLLLAVQP
jgi:beta-lactam-binding protein with PASTA domain